MLKVRVLGPMEVFDGGRWIRMTSGQQRVLLAALVAQAPAVVSVETLIDEVWGGHPTRNAQTQIHGYVSRLRRLLQDPSGELLSTCPPGYRLLLEEDSVDAVAAMVLVRRARAELRAEQFDDAARSAKEVLALWRGEPYADVTSTDLVEPHRQQLHEMQLAAWEVLISAELGRQRYDEVIDATRLQVKVHPLREQLWHYLMLALWRSGRQAEALDAYGQLRRLLAEELGIDPCTEIQDLYARLLAGDKPPARASAGDRPAQPSDVSGTGAGRVDQLPGDIADFTGRAVSVDQVISTVLSAQDQGPPSVIVVYGAPGAGKSSVVLRAARKVGCALS